MNEYSNNWDSLTMRDKAEMMKVAIANGITTLPEIRQAYNEFAKGGKMNNWTLQDEAGYRYWRSRLPKNLRDTNDNDYDMRAAYKAGLQPEWNPDDKSYHLGSRDSKTGRILKAPHHPTFLKALTTDAGMGYYPTMDGKGNTYTETWRGNVQYPREIEVPFKAYGGNLYGNGGSKVAHDAKYNHAVTLYQGYIDRGMTPQTALELTNQKIAEKGWTGWASGDNKKFSTPDAFMDHTVDFHERMYPDSLNVNNFNQFFNGLEEGKHKYNPVPTVYKRNLLMTRPGVKKRINEYRATQGQAPLALLYPGQEGTSLGYDIVQPDYMEPLQEQPNIAANGGVLFDEGGQKDSYIDADDRRHKILLETRDGNLYDSNGNNYTQSYLDEDNVPVVTGIMPRDTVHINANPIEELKEMGRSYIDGWVNRHLLAPNNYDTKKIGEKLFYGVYPSGYANPKSRILKAMNNEYRRSIIGDNLRNPVYAKYLGLEDYVLDNGKHSKVSDNLFISKFKPTHGDSTLTYYVSPSELDFKRNPLSDRNLAIALAAKNHYNKDTFVSPAYDEVMGNYTYSFGQDAKGKYLSYYDKWDLNPFKGSLYDDIDIAEKYGIGHPVELYNRRYYTPEDENNIKNKYKEFFDNSDSNTLYMNTSNSTFMNNPLYFESNTGYANGGELYAHGGYKPSASIKRRITDWEGSSMKTNRSFEAEANDFNKVIPAEIRSKLSPSQLDALYSYGYNVGMGNLKQRVLPTLVAYTQGKATREDVQRSMWASKDNILRGLTLRRNAEREMFGGNYRSQFTGNGLGYHMDQTLFQLPQEYFDDINAKINNVNLPQIQMPNNMDVDPATIYKPPVIDDTLFANPKPQAIEVPTYNPRQEGLDNLKKFNTIMGLFGQDTPFTGLVDNNKPSLLDYVGQIYS